MKAMIFAAGLGTRLKPLTDSMPKALVPVAGKPLMEHVIRRLRKSGIDQFVVNVHHFADMIQEWIDSQEWMCRHESERSSENVLVQISDERNALLETGGAILHARNYFEGCGRFLVHNVDILSNMDIESLLGQVKSDGLATLLVSPRRSSRQLLFEPSTMRLVGWRNSITGEVRTPYEDLVVSDCVSLAFSGIHIISDKIFQYLEEYVRVNGLGQTDAPARFSIVDFYLWMCDRQHIYGVCDSNLNLLDVGKSDSLDAAEEFLKNLGE